MSIFSDWVRQRVIVGLADRKAANELMDAVEFATVYLTGDVYFVHHSGGNATSNGSKTHPFATLNYGISRASSGDVVYVMPGHAENVTGSVASKAGVTVVGLGHGNLIPTITFTAAAGTISIATANFTMSNIRLVANFATGVTSAITIAAAGDGCTLDRIQCRDTSTANEFLVHVSVATTVTDLTIQNCDFVTLAGSLTNSILFAGSHTNCVIRGNRFFVDSSDSVIDGLAAAGVNILIKENSIINQDTDTAGYVIDMHASTTGTAEFNTGAYNKNDAEMTKGEAMWWNQNFFSNTIAESGLLEPATAHAIP